MTNRVDAGYGSLIALAMVYAGVFLIVIDTTIATVALPTIVEQLRLSVGAQSWIVNSYMLSYGGCLLLSGRLADLYGSRRVFLVGIAIFTAGSLACGISQSGVVLCAARAIQGIGGAAVTSVSVSLVATLSLGSSQRVTATAYYGFVCAAGGSTGQLLGGALTQLLGWRWIFLINVPIGALVYGLGRSLLQPDAPAAKADRIDISGAVLITSALTLATYTLVTVGEVGWRVSGSGVWVGAVFCLLILFVLAERRAAEPLIPPGLFKRSEFNGANILGLIWAAATLTWSVMAALYLQRVLGYDPMHAGLAFIPAEVVLAVLSGGLSARLTLRFGPRAMISAGFSLVALGLIVLGRAPVDGSFMLDVLPSMVLIGVGCGCAPGPLVLIAMRSVDVRLAGAASGVLNTSLIVGGVLGLALLAGFAELRTSELALLGLEKIQALNGGYHLVFLSGACIVGAGALLGPLLLRVRQSAALAD